MKMKRRWYERTEVAKVTKDWVDVNCKSITDREMDLLQKVYDRKLVARNHLEIICEGYRNLTEQSRTKVMNRSISKLFQMMALDKVHEKTGMYEGNKPCVVALDKAGSIILEQPHKKRIQHDKKVYNGVEHIFRNLPPNWKHINMVNELEVEAIQFFLKNGFQWKWRLENENYYTWHYGYPSQKITLIPDVVMGIHRNKSTFWAFVEVDTGSENHRNVKSFPVIGEKVDKYRRLKSATSIWEKDFRKFPFIFFITKDEKRIKWTEQQFSKANLQCRVVHQDDWNTILEELNQNIGVPSEQVMND